MIVWCALQMPKRDIVTVTHLVLTLTHCVLVRTFFRATNAESLQPMRYWEILEEFHFRSTQTRNSCLYSYILHIHTVRTDLSNYSELLWFRT